MVITTISVLLTKYTVGIVTCLSDTDLKMVKRKGILMKNLSGDIECFLCLYALSVTH